MANNVKIWQKVNGKISYNKDIHSSVLIVRDNLNVPWILKWLDNSCHLNFIHCVVVKMSIDKAYGIIRIKQGSFVNTVSIKRIIQTNITLKSDKLLEIKSSNLNFSN